MKRIAIFFAAMTVCYGDVSHQPRILQALLDSYNQQAVSRTQGPPNYSYQYSAGPYPEHVDRTQSETGDGYGRVHGISEYVDPNMNMRTLEYQGNNFYPSQRNYGDGSDAVWRATERHHTVDYQDNGYDFNPSLNNDYGDDAVVRATQRHRILYNRIAYENSQPTQYTDSVRRARNRHFYLYDRIAAEHAATG